jgi:hypothetical protein
MILVSIRQRKIVIESGSMGWIDLYKARLDISQSNKITKKKPLIGNVLNNIGFDNSF